VGCKTVAFAENQRFRACMARLFTARSTFGFALEEAVFLDVAGFFAAGSIVLLASSDRCLRCH
jgi:hypothetical protein